MHQMQQHSDYYSPRVTRVRYWGEEHKPAIYRPSIARKLKTGSQEALHQKVHAKELRGRE